MPKTTSFGYTDTTPAGGATKELTRPNLNFNVDFAKTEDSENKCILTNLTSPYDQPESMRFELADIKNIYNGTSIDPSVYAPSRAGISLLCQVNDILRVTDSEDSTYQVDLPISVHFVVKMPKSQYITAHDIESVVARCVSSMYETDSDGVSRLDALVRGSMVPSTI